MAVANFLMSDRANPDPRVAFWSRADLWPEDSPDYIFVARAVCEFAKSRSGDAWTDDIPASPMISELPADYSTYTPIEEIRRATSILVTIPSSYNNRPGEGMATFLTMGNSFPTTSEWNEAVAVAKVRSDQFWDRFLLFHHIVTMLSQACKFDQIKTATRPHDGGEPSTRPWHFWNMERSWVRFDTCRIDPKDEFSAKPFAGQGHWLFFDKQSFEAYMAGEQEATLPEPSTIEDLAAVKRSRPRGRPRGNQIDVIAGRFTQMVANSEITAESKVRDIARRLADWAAIEFEVPLDEGYIRERTTIWYDECFGSRNN